MVKPLIRLSSDLGEVEHLRAPLEEQLASALDAAVDKVDEHYHGEDAAEVAAELLEDTKAALHPDIADAIHPDKQQLRSVADSIVANQER